MEFSTSQLTTYKKCKKMWYYRFLLMLDPISFKRNLELGSYVHHLLDEFYKPTGGDSAQYQSLQVLAQSRYEHVLKASVKYFEEKTKDLFEEETEKFVEMRLEAEAILTRYIQTNAEDLLKYLVLYTEKEFSIRIPNPKGRLTRDVLRGKFDMIVQDEFDTIWFYEHKTTADGVDNRFDGVELEEQLNNYFMAMLQIYTDDQFGGGILNVIRKKAPRIPEPLKSGKGLSQDKKIDTTYELYLEAIKTYGYNVADYTDILNILMEKGDRFFGRKIVTRQYFQVQETRDEIFYLVKQIKADIKAFEKSRNEGIFFRCPNFMCKGCSYFNLCILDSKKGDVEGYIAGNFTKREVMNPELSVKAE